MRRGISDSNGVRWFFPHDHAHIQTYNGVIADHQQTNPTFTAPDWVQLTDKQRTNIRKANEEHWAEMRAFGDAIRKGERP